MISNINEDRVLANMDSDRLSDLSIVIVGHVDHGKSTVIGRLLADTKSLPDGKLEQVKETCRRNSKPFEYAFLLDALKDEQAQGITIDTARCFFKTKKRNCIIIDAPGHIEFLKNMITGASRAEAALLVIDASEGIQENSRRHGYMLSMLGIKQVCVLVNKMDLVNYNEKAFKKIEREYKRFLKKIDVTPMAFIPVSAMKGDNIAEKSDKMLWFNGKSVLEILDVFESSKLLEDGPFRMPVQDVYKFTGNGDDRRIIAGTIEAGKISVGDQVVFYPSGKRTTVKTIEGFNCGLRESLSAGWACGFTTTEQIYVKRGEMACRINQLKPKVTGRMLVSLFWLGNKPLVPDKKYYLKLGTVKVEVEVEEINKILNASSLNTKKKMQVLRNEVAECILKLDKHIAFDIMSDVFKTSRFVIVDNFEISGGGIILDKLEDETSWVRDKVISRNFKWINSSIPTEKRSLKYGHKPLLILITGTKDAPRKEIARELENSLFEKGCMVYYLGIGSLLYGVDADLLPHNDTESHKNEHIRRLSEVANILLDLGVIFIVSAIEITNKDLEVITTAVAPEKIQTIWIGENSGSVIPDVIINPEDIIKPIEQLLNGKNIFM